MEGNLVGSDEQNIRAQTTFGWLPGGFLLEQRARIDFAGQQLDAPGADRLRPRDRHLPSTVFSGFSPTPLPYRWDVRGDRAAAFAGYHPEPAGDRFRLAGINVLVVRTGRIAWIASFLDPDLHRHFRLLSELPRGGSRTER